MIVARVVNDQLQVVDRIKEMVRLAAGLDDSNRLRAEAFDAGISCLERFGQRLSDIPSDNIQAVGTNTLRRARNAQEFLLEAESALGHPINIIAGIEEARLIYVGVAHNVEQNKDRRLVIDIGGGSTEVIIGQGFKPTMMESLYIGCVSMSSQFFADGRIRRGSMRKAILAARQELEPIEEPCRKQGWEVAIGASGTILATDDIIRHQEWSAKGITLESLYQLRDALLDAGHIEALSLAGLGPERLPVFPGGVAILIALFEALGIKRMRCSDGALREGLLYDLLGRFHSKDIREATITDLMRRYHVDIQQAERVMKSGLKLMSQVAKTWQLRKDKYSNLLCWAARLHEVGVAIAHSQYHKHGAYLLQHSDMPGFSRQEQIMIAVLVHSHRRKFPNALLNSLAGKNSQRAKQLAILLRLSAVLHRSRSELPLPQIEAQADDDTLELKFPNGWLEAHPLTEADLAQEANYLQTADIRLLFS